MAIFENSQKHRKTSSFSRIRADGLVDMKSESKRPPRRRRGPLAPNPGLWAALDDGKKLETILRDFYAHVFSDEKLAPFFADTNPQWAMEKQCNFLKEIFTGERVYFGERPRNAHHWMVISDELFDYREAMMEDCLKRHGLSDAHIAEWRAVEEVFRKHIVKSKAVPKKLAGEELPLEGYESKTLDVGAMCDGCQSALDAGTTISYHVRTGRSYCPTCTQQREDKGDS
jgi:truncated hemoglobin YjbI